MALSIPVSPTTAMPSLASPYILDPKDAVANYASTGLIDANNTAPTQAGGASLGGLVSASGVATNAPSPLPGTVTNADSSTFNALGEAPKQAAYGYTPSARTLNPAKETVQGQFAALTQGDSPLIQMARTGAHQQMNARGLMDSSLALSAGDVAAYQAALPIASADATAQQQAARDNQAYLNEAGKFSAAAQNEAAKNELAVWTDLAKANLDSAMKTQLASIEADYKTTMQSSATAAEMYKQAMKNITDISASSTMDMNAKQVATQNQFYILKSGMEVAGAMANLNLGELLDFTAAPSSAPPQYGSVAPAEPLGEGTRYSWESPGEGWTRLQEPVGNTPGVWAPPVKSEEPEYFAYGGGG